MIVRQVCIIPSSKLEIFLSKVRSVISNSKSAESSPQPIEVKVHM